MKLYTAANSNFGARVALAARVKGIAIDEAPLPAGGLRSAEFLALNPIAKIPVLRLDDGTALAESETILRYLEARFPDPSLYPDSPEDRARIDRAMRIADLYVMAPVIRLFPHLDPSRRQAAVVEDEVGRWREGLAALAHFMRDPLPKVRSGVSMADCALVPALHLCTRIAAMLGLAEDPLASQVVLSSYYRGVIAHPMVASVMEALTLAQEAKDIQYGLPSLAARHREAAGLASTQPSRKEILQ